MRKESWSHHWLLGRERADGNKPTSVDGLSFLALATSPSHHWMLERKHTDKNEPEQQ
jgi:hypothetical protein